MTQDLKPLENFIPVKVNEIYQEFQILIRIFDKLFEITSFSRLMRINSLDINKDKVIKIKSFEHFSIEI